MAQYIKTDKEEFMIYIPSDGEITKIDGTTDYDITSFDDNKTNLYIFYRTSGLQFEQLQTADYELVEANNTLTLHIKNTTLLDTIELFQVGYTIKDDSSNYTPVGDVNVILLNQHFNELQKSFHDFVLYAQDQFLISDSPQTSRVMPKLDVDEIWVKTADGWRTFNIQDFESLIKAFETQFQSTKDAYLQELEDKKNDIENDIKTDVVAYATTQLDNHYNTDLVPRATTFVTDLAKTTTDAYFNADGKTQILDYIKTGDGHTALETATATATGNIKSAETTGVGAVQSAQSTGVSSVDAKTTSVEGLVTAEGTRQKAILDTEKDTILTSLKSLTDDYLKQTIDNKHLYHYQGTIVNPTGSGFAHVNSDVDNLNTSLVDGVAPQTANVSGVNGVTFIAEENITGASISGNVHDINTGDKITWLSGKWLYIPTVITTSTGGVTSLNGDTGALTLDLDDLNGLAKTAQAVDSAKLGGQLPSHFATQTDVTDGHALVNTLTGRVTVNESEIATNKTGIATVDGKTNSNKALIDTNTGNIHTNEANININKTTGAQNNALITTNTANIKTNTDHITTLTPQVALNKTNIDLKADKVDIGDKTNLTTETKTDLVSSINEVETTRNKRLDSRLKCLIDPVNGTWHKSVRMGNQVNKGFGATEGELTGVIGSENMYIGAGYTNLMQDSLIHWTPLYSSTVSESNGEVTVGNANGNLQKASIVTIDSSKFEHNANYYNSCWVENTGSSSFTFRSRGVVSVADNIQVHAGEKKLYTSLSNIGTGDTTIGFIIEGNEADADFKFKLTNLLIAKTDHEVPYVKDSIADGKLVIDEPWTSADHSFIGVEYEFVNSTTPVFQSAKDQFSTAQNDRENFKLTGIHTGVYDYIINKTIAKYTDDLSIYNDITAVSRGISASFLDLAYYNYKPESPKSIKMWTCYEGDLTEAELKRELALLKSGNFELPKSLNTQAQANIPFSRLGADGSSKGLNFIGAGEKTIDNGVDFFELQSVKTDEYVKVMEIKDDGYINMTITGIGDIAEYNGHSRYNLGISVRRGSVHAHYKSLDDRSSVPGNEQVFYYELTSNTVGSRAIVWAQFKKETGTQDYPFPPMVMAFSRYATLINRKEQPVVANLHEITIT